MKAEFFLASATTPSTLCQQAIPMPGTESRMRQFPGTVSRLFFVNDPVYV